MHKHKHILTGAFVWMALNISFAPHNEIRMKA